MPAEMIAVAESRVDMFLSVKGEIDSKMSEVHEGLA